MRKRIASLLMAVCVVFGAMLALTSCGEKSLQEYFETEEMQAVITQLQSQFEAQDSTADIYVDGDTLHFDVKLSVEVPAENLDATKASMSTALDQLAETFQSMADELKKNSTNESVTVILTYTDAAGTELATRSFVSAS